MKNLLFNLLNFFHNLFDKKIKKFKKIVVSPHLPLSKLNYFEKKLIQDIVITNKPYNYLVEKKTYGLKPI